MYIYNDEDNAPMNEENMQQGSVCRNCKHRTWCENKTTDSTDPKACDEYKIISQWWHDKISGMRDQDDEEIPFADEEDFEQEDFDDG